MAKVGSDSNPVIGSGQQTPYICDTPGRPIVSPLQKGHVAGQASLKAGHAGGAPREKASIPFNRK